MKNFLELIENKIKNNLTVEKIKIIDNTHRHTKHKFFDKDKFHISLEIQSKELMALNRLNAQRLIMNILKEELKFKIHALEIKIK
jgi:BolA protein|tara:strand:+ start:461 stop:715 length:255 start_codon:yes stop_codon:yes gene_type:complete